MATTQIDGARQIKSATITTTQLAAAAGIVDGQLATPYTKADGTRAFTGNQALGGFKLTGTGDASSDTDVPSWGQVKALSTSRDWKDEVDVATTAAGTLASSFQNGSTVDGQSLVTGWRILIKDQASAGENGIYTVNASGAPTRATDADSSAEVTAGMQVPVVRGTANAATIWLMTTTGAITVGTTGLTFVQVGETLTVDSSLVRTGHQLSRAALTGDVTASAGSNATTIAANAVSLGKMASLAANSVIGNLTGSGATPVAVGAVSAATASTVVTRDTNANTRVNSVIENFQTIASAAGTTTLTVASPRVTQITGSTTQTVTTPDATTLVVGQAFTITNRSSGTVTVNMNGGSLLQTMVSGSFLTATVTGIGSAAGTWDAAYTSAGGSGSVTTVSVASANGFAGSVSNASTTPAITLTTSITGVLKGNGTAISAATAGTDYYAPGGTDVAVADGGTGVSTLTGLVKGNGTSAFTAATAGTDYLAPSSYVVRETPSGSVNGSNVTFTLTNTPISGSEMVFLNGILQEPGAGNDYTISSGTITYLAAPISGDKIRVTYTK